MALAERPGFIVSPTGAKQLGQDFGQHPVGTGPFRFVEWVRDSQVTLERFPDYATARLILAKALADGGEPETALAEVRVILQGNPADAQAHRLAGDLERRAGRVPEALAHLRQAAALDPADRESRLLVEVLDGGGTLAGGSALARLLADDTFATVSFGTVCLEQGLVDEAAQIFLRILRKEPGHEVAHRRLEEALRVKIQRRKGS